jgi:hypothetical protein
MKNYVLFFLVSTSTISLWAAKSILEENLDTFIASMVSSEDRHDFRRFYNGLIFDHQEKKLSQKNKEVEKHRTEMERLLSLGRQSIEVKNPILAAQLKPFLNQPLGKNPVQQKKVNALLFRHGAYEDFLILKGKNQSSIFFKARSYVKSVSTKVANFIGSFRRSKAA